MDSRERFEDIAETIAVTLYEILRCAIYSANNPNGSSDNHRRLRDTGNLREGARNVVRKLLS